MILQNKWQVVAVRRSKIVHLTTARCNNELSDKVKYQRENYFKPEILIVQQKYDCELKR